MADCSCDFCSHDSVCPYAYDESDCVIETIKAAKVIVDDEFKSFLAKLDKANEDLCDENVDVLICTMRVIVVDSERVLPDWAMEEVKE